MNRDQRGFKAFYAETCRSVARYALLLDPQSGNDLAAEAFTRALERWTEVSGYERPEAWVRKVVLNLHRTRSRRQYVASLFRPAERHQRDLGDIVNEHVEILAALNKLSPRQRAAVILRYYEDLSLKETSEILGCTVSTANAHVRRALAKLRSRMDLAPGDLGDRGAGTKGRLPSNF